MRTANQIIKDLEKLKYEKNPPIRKVDRAIAFFSDLASADFSLDSALWGSALHLFGLITGQVDICAPYATQLPIDVNIILSRCVLMSDLDTKQIHFALDGVNRLLKSKKLTLATATSPLIHKLITRKVKLISEDRALEPSEQLRLLNESSSLQPTFAITLFCEVGALAAKREAATFHFSSAVIEPLTKDIYTMLTKPGIRISANKAFQLLQALQEIARLKIFKNPLFYNTLDELEKLLTKSAETFVSASVTTTPTGAGGPSFTPRSPIVHPTIHPALPQNSPVRSDASSRAGLSYSVDPDRTRITPPVVPPVYPRNIFALSASAPPPLPPKKPAGIPSYPPHGWPPMTSPVRADGFATTSGYLLYGRPPMTSAVSPSHSGMFAMRPTFTSPTPQYPPGQHYPHHPVTSPVRKPGQDK